MLSVLLAAESPVPIPWLRRIFDWTDAEVAEALEWIGSLFERRPEGVAPFHKSVRDWMTSLDAAGPVYVVDGTAGADALGDALWAAFTAWAGQEQRGPLDPFCVAELPAQFARANDAEIRERLARTGGWDAARQGVFALASARAEAFAWESALSWWRLAGRMAGASDEAAPWDQAYAMVKMGDTSRTIGGTRDALKSYRDGLAIAERLAASDPDNADWRRDLSVSYDNVGDVLVAQGDRAGALKSYRDGLAIAERLSRFRRLDRRICIAIRCCHRFGWVGHGWQISGYGK